MRMLEYHDQLPDRYLTRNRRPSHSIEHMHRSRYSSIAVCRVCSEYARSERDTYVHFYATSSSEPLTSDMNRTCCVGIPACNSRMYSSGVKASQRSSSMAVAASHWYLWFTVTDIDAEIQRIVTPMHIALDRRSSLRPAAAHSYGP